MTATKVESFVGRLPQHGQSTLLLGLGLFVTYWVTGEYQIVAGINDSLYTLLPAWSLAEFGNANLENYDSPTPLFPWVFEYNGHIRSDRFPGPIVMAVPFYYLFGGDGFSMEPGITSAVFASTVAICFLHRAMLRLVAPTVALGTALLTAFGTTVWSVAADSAWTHAPTLLGLSIGFWGLTRGGYWTAGLGYAISVFSRPHTAVVAAIQGVWNSIATRSVRPILRIGLASSLGIVGILVWNRYNAGEWTLLPGTYSYRVEAAVSTGPNGQASADLWGTDLIYTFFSPLRGIFVYSPFILVLLLGLFTAWKAAPPYVRAGAVSAVVYLAVQLSGNTWNGGSGFFGYRISLEFVYLLVPLGALAWVTFVSLHRWSRWLFGVVTAVTVWSFTVAASGYTIGIPSTVNPGAWAMPTLLERTGWGSWVFSALFVMLLFEVLRRYDRAVTASGVSDGPALTPDGRPNRRLGAEVEAADGSIASPAASSGTGSATAGRAADLHDD